MIVGGVNWTKEQANFCITMNGKIADNVNNKIGISNSNGRNNHISILSLKTEAHFMKFDCNESQFSLLDTVLPFLSRRAMFICEKC